MGTNLSELDDLAHALCALLSLFGAEWWVGTHVTGPRYSFSRWDGREFTIDRCGPTIR